MHGCTGRFRDVRLADGALALALPATTEPFLADAPWPIDAASCEGAALRPEGATVSVPAGDAGRSLLLQR